MNWSAAVQSPRNAELKLLVGLRRSTTLKYLGCHFDRGLVGGVTVTVRNHPLGAWWYDSERYCFSAIAYRPGRISVETVEQACDETQRLITGKMVREAVTREKG